MDLRTKNKIFSTQAFHTAVLNTQGSKQFLNKILPISISSILYERMELNIKDFTTSTYAGIEYKEFKTDIQNPLVQDIRDWVNSALDALNKNYLRELYLIFASIENPKIIYESYKFQVSYLGEDVISLETATNQKELTAATQSLFKAISNLTIHLPHKENEVEIKMAITFYEDITPPDYNPELFINDDQASKLMIQTLQKQPHDYLQLGLLETGYHIVRCRGRGEIFSMNRFTSSSTSLSRSQEETNNIDEFEKNISEENNNTSDTAIENNSRDEILRTPTISEISDISGVDLDTTIQNIQCMCKISAHFNSIGMVLCCKCSTIQHCVCSGYLYEGDVPDKYVCTLCEINYDLTPKREKRKMNVSIYRLAVAVAYFTEDFPCAVMDKLETEVKDLIVSKMKAAKILFQKNGKYEVNMKCIQDLYLKGLFDKSFKIKQLQLSMGSLSPKKRTESSMTLGVAQLKKQKLLLNTTDKPN